MAESTLTITPEAQVAFSIGAAISDLELAIDAARLVNPQAENLYSVSQAKVLLNQAMNSVLSASSALIHAAQTVEEVRR